MRSRRWSKPCKAALMKNRRKINLCLTTLLVLLVGAETYADSRDLKFKNACVPGTQITLSAVGDVLMHSALQRQADASNEEYKVNWGEAIPYLKYADIAYANLEGPVAPGVSCAGKQYTTQTRTSLGGDCRKGSHQIYTGYPKFNYHPMIVDNLKDSGIDVVSVANNHSLDRRAIGVDLTVDSLLNGELPFTGMKDRNNSKKDWYAVTRAKGKSVVWLACATSLNGQKNGAKQVLKCYNSTVEKLVSSLSKKFDAVVVTPHWGSEYIGRPNSRQKKYAKIWLDAGAVAVLGAHPHVVQPWEKYKTKDGRETLIVYSLGNFVSNQGDSGKPKQFSTKQGSAIIYLGITFSSGEAWINGVRYVPTYMRNRMTRHKKLFVADLDRSGKERATKKHLAKYFGSERISTSLDDLETNKECH